MIDYINYIEKLKSGNELIKELSVFPEYDVGFIQDHDMSTRLAMLSDIYQIYIPSAMTVEIYNKLYLALMKSLQKKNQNIAVQQRYENYKAIQRQSYNGIMGGSDSFTIVGTSGIGKSSAITRAISIMTKNIIIETEHPYTKIIPCLIVQCPFDSSVKGLLLEILRKIDEILYTNYYETVLKSRTTTTDMLMGMISNLAINHIGILIVDEIQNVVNSKNGKKLVGSLTQLINNSGISVCMVGTPECLPFFTQAMQLARRSLGLQYTSMPFDEYFQSFCKIVFEYQYVLNITRFTQEIAEWLYEHSAGVTSVVISLIHDAQEIAILNGKEMLNLDTLNEAYQQRMTLLHDYIHPTEIKEVTIAKKKETSHIKSVHSNESNNQNKPSIVEISKQAKLEDMDVVGLLKKFYTVTEVRV